MFHKIQIDCITVGNHCSNVALNWPLSLRIHARSATALGYGCVRLKGLFHGTIHSALYKNCIMTGESSETMFWDPVHYNIG